MLKENPGTLLIGNQRQLEIFSMWFLNDLAFNILPIFVILIINIAINESFKNILLLPEWSFATVVLFGETLSRFIELKTKIQKDPSDKVFFGTRFFSLLLIISVITLMLALLLEKGFPINSNLVGNLQFSLFIISALATILPIIYKIDFVDMYRFPPKKANPRELIRYLLFSLEEGNDDLRHAYSALNSNYEIINNLNQEFIDGSDYEIDIFQLESLLQQTEDNLVRLKEKWNTLHQNTDDLSIKPLPNEHL